MLDRIVRQSTRLFGRFSWFRRLHHPTSMAALVRPGRSHWSGLQVRCWKHGNGAGSLHVDIYSALMEYARGREVHLVLPAPVGRLAPRRTHMPCPYPWESMVVLGNGDVMACCVPGTKVGNLHGSSLEQIWKGDAMRQFRARVNTDDPPDACSVCPMIRLPHDFASYVPGLPERERHDFEQRCADAHARGML